MLGNLQFLQVNFATVTAISGLNLVDVCADVMDVGEGIASETAIKLMHKEIGICSRYRVQTRKCVFMDKIRYDTSEN